jgi:hypothetical protein
MRSGEYAAAGRLPPQTRRSEPVLQSAGSSMHKFPAVVHPAGHLLAAGLAVLVSTR